VEELETTNEGLQSTNDELEAMKHLVVAQAPRSRRRRCPELNTLVGVEHHHTETEAAQDALQERR
jgi:hypothetical protein